MNIVITISMFSLITFWGCSDDCNNECKEKNLECDCCPKVDTSKIVNDTTKLNQINVFIETSGSMSGLMPDNNEFQTEFQTVIPDILIRLNDEFKNTNLFSIYDTKSEFKKLDIDSTRKYLITKGKFSWSGSTYIPIMIDSVINHVDNESVNILISDCIYTPEIQDLGLTSQTISEIREKFNKISKAYSTIIYCVKSDFYFTKQSKVKSPFYIILFGNQQKLNKVKSLLKKSFSTFNQEIFEIEFGEKYSNFYYSILPYSFNSGNNIPIKCTQFDNSYLVLSDIDFSGNLSFVIGLNLNDFPAFVKSNEYLEKNIQINLNNTDFKEFKLVLKDDLLKEIKNDDKMIFERCTHFLSINVNSLEYDINEMNLSIKFQPPDWINQLNNPELSTAESNREKTYGLNKIMKGLEESYNVTNNSYILNNLKIILKK